MELMGVPLGDWISLAVGLIGFVVALLSRRGQMPESVKRWLDRIGQDDVLRLIGRAQEMLDWTPEQKRAWVVEELQKLALDKCGIRLPASVANALVELLYQQWKKLSRRSPEALARIVG